MPEVFITLETVQRALALPGFDGRAAQARMSPIPRPVRRPEMAGAPKQAGVLIVLYPGPDGDLHFVLMRRTEYPGVHSGQISLPGGRCEPGETYQQTALRETEEEFGFSCDGVEVLGALHPLYVMPSDFEIHPYVGFVPQRPHWHPDHSEVAEVIEVPLRRLLDDSIKGFTTIERAGMVFEIGYYQIGAHRVWGATAGILSELETRLRAALALPEGHSPARLTDD